jgi:hypothetical protein
MRIALATFAFLLTGIEVWAQTAPTLPTLPAVIPTLPIQAARPYAPCRPMRFEPCSSTNLPLGLSIAVPASRPAELHSFTGDQKEVALGGLEYYGVMEPPHQDIQGKLPGKAVKAAPPRRKHVAPSRNGT